MELRSDFSARAVIHTDTEDWTPSPMAGVDRIMLDRIGDEVARATSIVRYAPGSRFSEHTHDEGEEFLVLDGVFSDRSGDYGPGSYVRNPPGTAHAPWSEKGCTIFVKLRQFDPADTRQFAIDTGKASWQNPGIEGFEMLPLHTFGDEQVALVRWRADTQHPRHDHPGGEEILVLDGAFEDEHGTYEKGTWLRLPPGSSHRPVATGDCLIYVKRGHLTAA